MYQFLQLRGINKTQNSHIYLKFSYLKKWNIASQMIYLIFMRMFTLTITIERFLISLSRKDGGGGSVAIILRLFYFV